MTYTPGRPVGSPEQDIYQGTADPGATLPHGTPYTWHEVDSTGAHVDTWHKVAGRADLAVNMDAAVTALAEDPASAFAVSQSSTFVSRLAPRLPRPRDCHPTLFSTFQPGHGWTSATWTVDDSSAPVIGSQCMSLASATTSNCDANATISATDLTAQHIALLVKVESSQNINSINLLTASDAGFANYTNWYLAKGGSTESASTIPSQVWTWVYATTAGAGVVGDGGLSAVTHLRLRASAKPGVSIAISVQAVGYFPIPAPYQDGVVTIGFDDCAKSQITKAAPKLAQYGYKGQIYTIRDVLGTSGYLTESDLDTLHDVYGFGIGGHAWTRANHNLGFSSIPLATAQDEMERIREWLINKGFRGADHFAWPRGEDSPELDRLARRYFSTGRAVNVATSFYPLPSAVVGDMPMRMRAHVPSASTLPAVTMALIDQAQAAGGWLQLGYHDIVDAGASGSTQYLTADFNTVVDYIATTGIPVRTLDEVLQAVNASA